MMDVVITKTKLKVGVKGQPPIIEVRLAADCRRGRLAVPLQAALSDQLHFVAIDLPGRWGH